MRSIRKQLALLMVLAVSVSTAGCGTDDTPPAGAEATLVQQLDFPPDFSRAESIVIVPSHGYRFTVRRGDSAMMWNRDELVLRFTDATGRPMPDFRNLRFTEPNEYLFDAIIETLFMDREYMLAGYAYPNPERHIKITIYDDGDIELMAFHLINWNLVVFNDVSYRLYRYSPMEVVIDWWVFTVAQILNQRLVLN